MLTATPTLKDSMPAATGAQLTCFPADSPASHSALPGSARAIRMTVRSGLKCSALLTKSDPVGLLVKTLLASPRWASTACYLTWKRRVTPAKQFYYQLAVSVPRIGVTGYGLLRTPAAQEPGISAERLVTKDGQPARIGERAYDKHTGRLAQVGIIQQVSMLLPTPDASLATGGKLTNLETVSDTGRTADGKKRQISLPDRMRRLLPTPTTNDAKNGSLPESQRNRDGLAGSILRGELLPTPHANCHTGPGQKGTGGPNLQTAVAMMGTPTATMRVRTERFQVGRQPNPAEVAQKLGGSLNPRFVGEMMGYPASYCELQQPTIQWTELN